MKQELYHLQSELTFFFFFNGYFFLGTHEEYSHTFLKEVNFCQNSCAYSSLEDFLAGPGKIISLDFFGIYWYVKVGEVTFC